jgi:hypothetical protein
MNDFDEPRADEPWRDHRDELLERVTKRGRALKVRRQAALVTVATCVLLVPFAAVAATNTQTNVPVLRWASSGSDEPADTTTTTLLATTTTTVDETTSTTVSASTTTVSTVPGATSTTTLPFAKCRNGYDPDCGPLVWDPEPPAVNPIGVDVSVASIDGRTATFTVNTATAGLITVDYGDGSDPESAGNGGIATCYGQLFGTWAWPAITPQSETFSHEYAKAGSYTVTVTVAPALLCGETPYTEGSAAATVAITDLPATTTTTRP